MRKLLITIPILALTALGTAEAPEEEGFVSIFDGKSLDHWRAANEPGHASGCTWGVREGAIDGTQDYPGAWGILATSEEYGDFELRLEVKAVAPFEAGILLRATMEGHGYLVTVHPAPGGDVGGIAGVRIGDFRAPAPDWKKAWKEDDYNELRIEVKGQPPEIRTWLNGAPMAALKGTSKDPRVGATGHVALKLGGPTACFGEHLLVRNVRVRRLETPEGKR